MLPLDPGLCHSCGISPPGEIVEFTGLHRVTSDCRGWKSGGRLGVCPSCGLVQAIIDDEWRREAGEIYEAYRIYYQSGGEEQVIYDPGTGEATPRSRTLVDQLKIEASLPDSGSILDIGCGNGAFLRAVSERLPGWRLHGTELSDKYRTEAEAIPGFEKLFTGKLEEIEGQFDLVSLIHVLEHIESPGKFLSQVIELTAPGGLVFVQVPFFIENPFDLVIADHASHFTEDALAAIGRGTGLEVVSRSTLWATKELSCLFRRRKPGERSLAQAKTGPVAATADQAAAAVSWLGETRDRLQRPKGASTFGIFGTSIGANWLLEELRACDRTVDFFVDEDVNRIGRQLHGAPILSITEVPADAIVALALPPITAIKVKAKLAAAGVAALVPGSLTGSKRRTEPNRDSPRRA